MKIKWNWGTAIFIAIAMFMVFIFTLVYMSTNNQINLVEKDYYPKGLKFQDRIEEVKNARQFEHKFKLLQKEDHIQLTFPEIYPDTGTVVFFRPSDTQSDRTFSINPDSLWTMSFPANEFIRGKYVLKVHWKEDGKGYFIEKSFYFK